MKRLVLLGAAAALIAAAAAVWLGYPYFQARMLGASPAVQAAEPSGATAYYQHPEGEPFYSLTPEKTDDGRAYRAVPVTADIRFDDHEAAVAETPKSQRKIKYYRNPMGLPDTSLAPKKDSMGMDYIPVYEGEDSDDDSVKLSPGKIQRTGVRSEPVSRRMIRALVRAPGVIRLDERRVSVIAMRSESFVIKVADVTTGSHVIKGQPLVEIYSPSITSAGAEFLATINSKLGGDGSYGRGSRQRLINLDLPESAINAIEKTRVVPTSITWTSPRDGIVLERTAVDGMRVEPGGVLFRVADQSLMWALIDVAERDLGRIAKGQTVTVRARSYPSRTYEGKIEVIYPEINKETRTARLRVEVQNQDLALLHDMFVDAEIAIGNGEPVLAVPESAVMDTGRRQVVLIEKGNGRFEPREVTLGERGEGYVEIRSGLNENDPVVVTANFLIDAESNLKAALKGFDAGAAK